MPVALNVEQRALFDADYGPAPDIEANLNIASQKDPQLHADQLNLAEQARVPINVVEHFEPEIKRRQAFKGIDIDQIRSDNPGLTKFLQDQDNVAIAYDDLPALKGLEDAVTRPDTPWYQFRLSSLDNITETIPEAFRQGLRGIMMAGVDAQILAPQISPEELEGVTPRSFTDLQKIHTDRIVKEIEAGEKRIAELTPDDLSILESGIRSGLESTVQQVPGLMAAIATRSPTIPLTLMGAQTGFRAYGGARAEGKTPLEAATYAGTDAAIEVLTELIPTGKLINIVGDFGAGKTIKDIVQFTASEIGGEQAATILQSANAYIHDLDKELTKAETVEEMLAIQADRQAVTFFASLVGSGLQSGIASSAGYALSKASGDKMEIAAVSDMDQQRIDEIIDLAQSSETAGRASERFENFLNGVPSDMEIHIASEAIEQLEDAPVWLTDMIDNTGADVSIPVSQFITGIVRNEPLLTALRPHIRLRPESMTAQELDQRSEIEEILGRIEQEEDVRNKAQDLHDQLVKTERLSEITARYSVAQIEAFVNRAAEEHGITIDQVYEDMKLEIFGPEQVVEAVDPLELYQDTTVTTTETIIETGETVEIVEAGDVAYNRTQQRVQSLSEMLECLRN